MNASRVLGLGALLVLVACGDGEARVQQLEDAVREQEARQQRFEARVANSLDRLATRVDTMVVELATTAGVEVPTAAPPVATPMPRADRESPDAPRALRASEIADLVASRHRPWMWAVVVAACAAALALGWRWLRRLPRARQESSGDAWGEAAVLSGGVSTQAAGPAAAARELPPDFVLDDEVFVLDPGDLLDLEAAAEPATAEREPVQREPEIEPRPVPIPRPAANGAGAPALESPREPPRWSFQLEAADPVLARAAIAAYLRHDPRVLQRPAPVVRDHPSGLAVECALLPGLVAGEREHLRATLQRLVLAR